MAARSRDIAAPATSQLDVHIDLASLATLASKLAEWAEEAEGLYLALKQNLGTDDLELPASNPLNTTTKLEVNLTKAGQAVSLFTAAYRQAAHALGRHAADAAGKADRLEARTEISDAIVAELLNRGLRSPEPHGQSGSSPVGFGEAG